MKWFYLILGSVAGGVTRYLFAGAIYQKLGSDFPYGTLIVNLTGCFFIGFLAAIVDDKFFLGPNARILLMTGFCGAYTTFSTYMLETGNLVRDGQFVYAGLNLVASTAVGFAAYWLGTVLGDLI